MWVYLERAIQAQVTASAKALRHLCWHQRAKGRGAGDEGTEELGMGVGRSGMMFGFLPE